MTTIVLIDDDEDELEIMKDCISEVKPAAICLTYTDPEEALKALNEESIVQPDFVFIDINMPKLTGDICLQELRGRDAYRNVCIAMVSTSMDENSKKRLLAKGADFALLKPYQLTEYARMLGTVFGL